MKAILLLAILAFAAGAMAQGPDANGFLTAPSGMKYKIFSMGGNEPLKQGDMLKLFFEQRIEDSVLMTSREAGHQMAVYDTNWAQQTYSVAEVMPLMMAGDSVVSISTADTIIKKFFNGAPAESIPAFLKPGRSIYAYLRIVKKYTDSAEFRKDQEAEAQINQAYMQKMQEKAMAEQKIKDEAGFAKSRSEFENFMASRKAGMKTTASGVYVETLKPGTGPACTNGATVSVRYRGTLLNGTEFDTNFEKPGEAEKKPAFTVVMGQPGAITGFMEGVGALRKGARAKIYLPAETAYGGQQAGPLILPYSNLIFELFIEDVKPAGGTAPKPKAPVKKPVVKKPAPKKPVKK